MERVLTIRHPFSRMKILIFILCSLCASAQTFERCVCLSIKPVVHGKLDTTRSYIKHLVLQRWPQAWQMPSASDYDDWLPYCKQRIEVEIQEPYWKEPKQYTFVEFKRLIYGK